MRSRGMKLLAGAIAYLAFTAALAAATVAGLASLDRRQPEAAVTASLSHNDAGLRLRAREEVKADPDRVPVWIVATAKYEYTPVPIDPRPKRAPLVIGQDARAAMAKARPQSGEDGRRAIQQALRESGDRASPALGFARARDNDPFFRD